MRVPAVRDAVRCLTDADSTEKAFAPEALPCLAILHPLLRLGEPIHHVLEGPLTMPRGERHHHEPKPLGSGPLFEHPELEAANLGDLGRTAGAGPDRSTGLHAHEPGV